MLYWSFEGIKKPAENWSNARHKLDMRSQGNLRSVFLKKIFNIKVFLDFPWRIMHYKMIWFFFMSLCVHVFFEENNIWNRVVFLETLKRKLCNSRGMQRQNWALIYEWIDFPIAWNVWIRSITPPLNALVQFYFGPIIHILKFML